VSGRGGDHELDVASILRRAQDPAGLAELRRSIEELRSSMPPAFVAILEALQSTREEIHAVARAVGELAERPAAADASNLVDTSAMISFTVEHTADPRNNDDAEVAAWAHGRQSWIIEPPFRLSEPFFCAEAISAEVFAADNRDLYGRATIISLTRNDMPLLPGPLDASRWAAPAGRGHPLGIVFSSLAHKLALRVAVRCDSPHPVIVALTISGCPTTTGPSYNRDQCGGGNFR
jgi:hypothetical protein